MKFMMLVCIGLLSALLTFVMNWLALIPWRSTNGKHWSERARAYFPALVSATSNLWTLPAAVSMSVLLLFPENGPHWTLVALVASLGAAFGTIPMNLEVFPRVALRDLWSQIAKNWVIRFLMWFVFLAAIALMPDEFNFQAIAIPIVVVVLLVWWSHKGWLQVGQWLGLMITPSEQLVNIVQNTAAKMNIAVSKILVLWSQTPQAYALPAQRALLFSERLIQLLSDDEIAAVCAHELAHLTEARSDYFKRYTVWLMFLPWLFVKPMIHNFDMFGVAALALVTVIAPFIFRRVSHKLEVRADAIAHANEPDTGVYARALAKLYQDALLPAVNAKERATHPHLYDRLLAAGVTPDFPRPKPTSAISLNGIILSMAVGMLAVLVLSHIAKTPLFR